MSLRSFHLLFIIASVLLSLMMAVWGGVTYGTVRGTGWHLVTVIGALRPTMRGPYSSTVLSFQRTDKVSVDSPSTWLIAPSKPTRRARR